MAIREGQASNIVCGFVLTILGGFIVLFILGLREIDKHFWQGQLVPA